MANEKVVLRRGPSSSIPSTKVPGTILIETDTGRTYVDDTESSRIQIKDDTKLPLEGTAKKAESDVNGNSLVDRITTAETDSGTGLVTLKNEKGESKGTVVNSSYVDAAVNNIAQSDYLQNDSSSKDYIKNRTHWSEDSQVEILSSTEITTTDVSSQYPMCTLASFLNLQEGSRYTVAFQSNSYEVICNRDHQYNSLLLGNYDINYEPDFTKYPFLIESNPNNNETTVITQNPGTYTISASELEIIHQIDPKYLPNQGQSDQSENDPSSSSYIKNRTHWTEFIDYTEIYGNPSLPFQSSQFGLYTGSVDSNVKLEAGKTYTVYWDSSSYTECIAHDDSGITTYIGNGKLLDSSLLGNSEPFVIETYNDALNTGIAFYTASTQSTHSVGLVLPSQEYVRKLDSKYIPELHFIGTASKDPTDSNIQNVSTDFSFKLTDGARITVRFTDTGVN